MSRAARDPIARAIKAATRPRRAPKIHKVGKPPIMPEDEIQIEIASRLDAAGILWCHVPNEGRCSKREGGRRKARGVKAGVPDFLIFDPVHSSCSTFGYVGAALEIKRVGGAVSPEQSVWLEELAQRGWATAVAFGLDAALVQLRAWGYAV